MKIYLVNGYTANWECDETWTVAAFADADEARKLAFALNAWCDEQGCQYDHAGMDLVVADKRPPDDPGFRCRSHGVKYTIVETQLRGEVSRPPMTGEEIARANADDMLSRLKADGWNVTLCEGNAASVHACKDGVGPLSYKGTGSSVERLLRLLCARVYLKPESLT